MTNDQGNTAFFPWSFVIRHLVIGSLPSARDHRAEDRSLFRAGDSVEDRVDVQPHIAAVAIDNRLGCEAYVVVDKGRDAVLRGPPLEGLSPVFLLEFFDGH